MHKNLYVDIGNTMIKMNYILNNKEVYFSILSDKKLLASSLPKGFSNQKFKKIYLCSVVPEITISLTKILNKMFHNQIIILDSQSQKSLKIMPEHQTQVGADLVSLGIFVASKTDNGIIINMGTATTIIHVKNNTLMGVIISPGLISSLNSMVKNARKLSSLKPESTNKVIGVNTNEAISIGVINGHYQMIKGLVSKIDKNARIFISGGDSKFVKKLVNYEYIKEATIEGLKVVGNKNE
jgi:type III pantothenate kinase